jgi:hypothetical protein
VGRCCGVVELLRMRLLGVRLEGVLSRNSRSTREVPSSNFYRAAAPPALPINRMFSGHRRPADALFRVQGAGEGRLGEIPR